MNTDPMINPALLCCATDGSEITVVEEAEKYKGGIDPFQTKRTFSVFSEYGKNNLVKLLREVGMTLVSRVEIIKFDNDTTYLYMYTESNQEFVFRVTQVS